MIRKFPQLLDYSQNKLENMDPMDIEEMDLDFGDKLDFNPN